METTNTPTATTPAPGDRVRVTNPFARKNAKARTGLVLSVGPCDWDQCEHGDACFEVKVDGTPSPMRFGAEALTVA